MSDERVQALSLDDIEIQQSAFDDRITISYSQNYALLIKDNIKMDNVQLLFSYFGGLDVK